jgi:hypothetical protein
MIYIDKPVRILTEVSMEHTPNLRTFVLWPYGGHIWFQRLNLVVRSLSHEVTFLNDQLHDY